jgi:4-amino-4-deoxy-L-arabinose transferase-like glycosyltransferase
LTFLFPTDTEIMKKNSANFQTLTFYVFAAAIFLLIVCKDLFSNGMFLDGLIYSTVSKNLSQGLGTFWNPHFTSTCIPDFHEHPPLAFGIQSVFFLLFGQSRFVDRSYSILTLIITGFVILKIWKILGFKSGWIPLLFWLITPTVFWTSYNNLLENTLSIFTSLSVLFYLKYREYKKFYFILLSGLMLAFGFLTKGFVAFFPWTFPFILWLFIKDRSFGRMFYDSLRIFFFTVVPLILLVVIVPAARLSLHKYISNQVIDSIQHIVTVDSRFDIVKRLFSEIALQAVLSVIFIFAGRLRRIPVVINTEYTRKAMVFISVGLTGVLPIMISMKQSGFYILPAYPLFSVGTAILMYPFINSLLKGINYRSKGFVFFRWLSYGLFSIGIILSVLYSGGYSRDKSKISDTYSVLSVIPVNSTINILPGMYEDWSLHAYFARFKNVSLDPDLFNEREYLLIKNENYSDTLKLHYEPVNINAADYKLFRKK